MDKIFKFSFVLILLASHVNGQSNLLNAKKPQQIGIKSDNQKKYDNTKPLEYGYIDDRDVMFGKKVWETIDLNERINFPLYYPLSSKLDRLSLFETLRQHINNSPEAKIKDFVFDGDDEYFKLPIGKKDIEKKFKDRGLVEGAIDTINAKYNPKNFIQGSLDFDLLVDELIKDKKLTRKHYVEVEIESSDIKSYAIQGYWYFDKRLAELKYRLIAIGPRATPADVKVNAEKNKKKIQADAKQKAKDDNDRQMTQQEEEDMIKAMANEDKNTEPSILFWIYYPSIRSILKTQNTFNDRNSSKPINFDDLLLSRHYNAVIYKEENVNDDRAIAGYKPNDAMDQLLESERVKEKIRDYEHDMWNY
jgi:gliding motility associated protien GldN